MVVFHALARMGVEALVLVSPERPLASVGYFQDVEKEIDLAFCARSGIPVMRREVGGGATYLDQNQIFYQVIWKRDNTRLPRQLDETLLVLSQAPCETYHRFGIETLFRPHNDIVTKEGRKIAGQGGGNIGSHMVFVGGILMDFDHRTMSRILKTPDDKFRDKILKTMDENVTTMKREMGTLPPRQEIVSVLAERFSTILGTLTPAHLDRKTINTMEAVEQQLTSERFLFRKTTRIPRGIRIREGIEILSGVHKASGGLIRVVESVEEDRLHEVSISGDFQCCPKEELSHLEQSLRKTPRDRQTVRRQIESFYEKAKLETPGVYPEDMTEPIMTATP
jgi:lipoate-protein ligase A